MRGRLIVDVVLTLSIFLVALNEMCMLIGALETGLEVGMLRLGGDSKII